MHVGNVAAIQLELIKLVHAGPVCYFPLHIHIVHAVIVYHSILLVCRQHAGRRDFRRPRTHRQQQRACRHKRQHPAAGPGQGMGGQAFHDRAHIILATVPCDFRHNHVAFSNIAPNNLVNLIHKNPSICFLVLICVIITGVFYCYWSFQSECLPFRL